VPSPKHAPRPPKKDEPPEPPAETADLDEAADEYLLLKVVEANGEHLKTMRWGLGLGVVVLLLYVCFGSWLNGALGAFAAGLLVFALSGSLLAAGLHALGRQLDLLRRAVAATDHFVFGPAPPQEPDE
jgi:hypothetical protein